MRSISDKLSDSQAL